MNRLNLSFDNNTIAFNAPGPTHSRVMTQGRQCNVRKAAWYDLWNTATIKGMGANGVCFETFNKGSLIHAMHTLATRMQAHGQVHYSGDLIKRLNNLSSGLIFGSSEKEIQEVLDELCPESSIRQRELKMTTEEKDALGALLAGGDLEKRVNVNQVPRHQPEEGKHPLDTMKHSLEFAYVDGFPRFYLRVNREEKDSPSANKTLIVLLEKIRIIDGEEHRAWLAGSMDADGKIEPFDLKPLIVDGELTQAKDGPFLTLMRTNTVEDPNNRSISYQLE